MADTTEAGREDVRSAGGGDRRDFETYPVGLVPGPTSVPSHVREAFAVDYGSADLERGFFDLYARVQRRVAGLLRLDPSRASSASSAYTNDVIVQVGEGMLALWSAMKSTVRAGDRVLAVANGVLP